MQRLQFVRGTSCRAFRAVRRPRVDFRRNCAARTRAILLIQQSVRYQESAKARVYSNDQLVTMSAEDRTRNDSLNGLRGCYWTTGDDQFLCPRCLHIRSAPRKILIFGILAPKPRMQEHVQQWFSNFMGVGRQSNPNNLSKCCSF